MAGGIGAHIHAGVVLFIQEVIISAKFKPTAVYQEQFMRPFTLDKSLTVLQGTQGVGKTQQLIRAIDESPYFPIYVVHRVALTSNIVQRHNVFSKGPRCKYYEDMSPDEWAAHDGPLGVTINSLPKLMESLERLKGGYVFVLDEVHQQLPGLSGDHLRETFPSVLRALEAFIKAAAHVVIADADVNTLEVELVATWQGLSEGEVAWVHNTYTPDLGHVTLVQHYQEALDEVLIRAIHLERKLYVYFDSKRKAQEVAALLEFQGRNVLLITSDTDDVLKRAFMQSPYKVLREREIDVLIGSPSLQTGVDLSEPYFQDVFLFGVPLGFHTSRDYIQALRRVRRPSGDVFVYVGTATANLRDRPEDPDVVLERHLANQRDLERVYREADLTYSGEADDYYLYLSDTAAKRNADINRVHEVFPEALLSVGYSEVRQYSPLAENADTLNGSAFDEPTAQDNYHRFKIIETMEKGMFWFEGEKVCFNPDVLRQTKAARDAYRYVRTNGWSADDAELIVRDTGPDKFQHNVNFLELLLRPQDDVVRLHHMWLQSPINPPTPHSYVNQPAISQALKDIMAAAGINFSYDDYLENLDGNKLFEAFQDHRGIVRARNGLDMTPPTTPEKAIKAFRSLLQNKFYLQLAHKQVSLDGRRSRYYYIYRESSEAVKRVLDRRNRWNRTRNGLVVPTAKLGL